MYKFKFVIIMLMAILFMNCNIKTDTGVAPEENIQQTDYVINKTLSSNDYSEIESISPQNGLVPTADIAFRIAESILNEIYGKEHIEKEKPFSVNLENDIWLIEGHLEDGYEGGVAYIEIRKGNGEIVKVTHGK
jgi:hypothetical protein